MPAVQLTPNEKEFYRRECVLSESHAKDNWDKRYRDKLETYDALYKHIPGMQRCLAGIDTQEGLRCMESGGLKANPRPRSVKVTEMSKKSFVNRPKSGAQKVGYGGLGVHSDYIVPDRAADTIYERDYCVKLGDFDPHIRGINMTKTSVDGPWRRPGDGTMAVIPTKWQFPSGTKQPEGHLVRSELRKLRLAKEEAESKAKQLKPASRLQQTNSQVHRESLRNPLKDMCVGAEIQPVREENPIAKVGGAKVKHVIRETRPVHSRSWAPADNTAPRGWYKVDLGPAKLLNMPGRETVLNTPQARLNVLRRKTELKLSQ